jgi:ferric-dicitrate binding protein FerR (iron transport regulator)
MVHTARIALNEGIYRKRKLSDRSRIHLDVASTLSVDLIHVQGFEIPGNADVGVRS